MRASKREIRVLAEMIRNRYLGIPEHRETQLVREEYARLTADFIELHLSPKWDRNGNSRFDRGDFLRECGL